MIRKVIKASSQTINFQIPHDYVGKKIEVIAFVLNEEDEAEEEQTTTHLASETVLAKDWLNSEEDKAWHSL